MEQHPRSGREAVEVARHHGATSNRSGRPKRLLRVAIVRDGRIMEEKILSERASLSLGPTERHTFVTATAELQAAVELIQTTAKGRILVLPRGAHAVLSLDGETVTFAPTLEARSILLDDESRGRVSLERLTVLFHLTEAPPPRPRPALPDSLRTGLRIDWTTTVIAAFSFLFHFGIVGSIYSDWLDPLVDDHIVIGEVVESLASLPSTPPAEDPAHEVPATRVAPAPTHATVATTPRSEPRGVSRSFERPPPTAMGDARAASLAQQMKELDAVVASTLAVGGPSTDEVLSPDTRMLDLDAIASQNRVSSHGSTLLLGSDGDGPARTGDLRDLAHRGGEPAVDSGNAAGPKRAVAGRVDMST